MNRVRNINAALWLLCRVADDCARSKNAHKMQAAARLFQEIWKAAGLQGIPEQVLPHVQIHVRTPHAFSSSLTQAYLSVAMSDNGIIVNRVQMFLSILMELHMCRDV